MGLFDNPIQSIGRGAIGAGLGGAILGPVGTTLGGAWGWLSGAQGDGGPNQQTPYGAPPPMKPYESIRDPKTGQLLDPYKVNPGKMSDASAWQKAARGQSDIMTQNAVSAANQRALAGTQNAWGQLAMGGGIDSGARERIAKAGGREGMMAAQQAKAQGDATAMNIDLQRANMDRAAEQFNIGNDFAAQQANARAAMGDVGGVNQYNQNVFDQGMRQYLAERGYATQSDMVANRPKGLMEKLTSWI